jgi:hypothetical protein
MVGASLSFFIREVLTAAGYVKTDTPVKECLGLYNSRMESREMSEKQVFGWVQLRVEYVEVL